MASGADMRGGPQQRPPALQHVRGYVEGYEAGLSGGGLEWSRLPYQQPLSMGQSIESQMAMPGETVPVPVRLDAPVSVSNIL